MTRDEVIQYIARSLWLSGVGNKKGGQIIVTKIVDKLIEAKVIVVRNSSNV